MPLLTWNDSYSVKVGRFDEEHKKLVSLLNALHQAMAAGSGRAVMAPVIREMQNYAATHFQNEEKLMERTGYPALPSHRLRHDEFVAQVQKFSQDWEENRISTVEVIHFLRDWLLNHIQKTDRLYGPHLNAHGIT
jgi:hemerythrin